MTNALITSISKRRTQYALGRALPISQTETTELIEQAVRLAPSSFNSQSSRAVILYGEESRELWRIVESALRRIVPEDQFAPTKARIDGFAAGAGTVLFFEDQAVVASLQEKFASYADNFPIWSEQASGMAQFAVWSALANADVGASLQHYNPLIDAAVAERWQVPASWKLRAQMPFGSHEKPFGEKAYMDDGPRFKVFGALEEAPRALKQYA